MRSRIRRRRVLFIILQLGNSKRLRILRLQVHFRIRQLMNVNKRRLAVPLLKRLLLKVLHFFRLIGFLVLLEEIFGYLDLLFLGKKLIRSARWLGAHHAVFDDCRWGYVIGLRRVAFLGARISRRRAHYLRILVIVIKSALLTIALRRHVKTRERSQKICLTNGDKQDHDDERNNQLLVESLRRPHINLQLLHRYFLKLINKSFVCTLSDRITFNLFSVDLRKLPIGVG